MSSPGPPLDYDPYSQFFFLRPLGRVPRFLSWLALPLLFGIGVLVSVTEHHFSQPGAPRWSDLGALVGLGHPGVSRPDVPFLRDWCSMILLVTIGLSFVCAQYQWADLRSCLPALEESGAWRWRSQRGADRLLTRRALAGVKVPGNASCRSAMRQVLEHFSRPNTRTAVALLIVGVALAAGLSLVESQTTLFAPLEPRHLSRAAAGHWATRTYDGWWASWQHPAGAIFYLAIAFLGLLLVMSQNATSVAAIRALTAAELFAFFDADWLNRDGAFGWLSVRRVFRAAYLSIALRGVQLTAVLVLLNLLSVGVLLAVATIWLVFLFAYVAYPFRVLRRRCHEIKTARIEALSQDFERRGLKFIPPSDEMRAYIDEIARVRHATINPMRLASWQTSGFLVVVLLPIFLTLVQIFV